MFHAFLFLKKERAPKNKSKKKNTQQTSKKTNTKQHRHETQNPHVPILCFDCYMSKYTNQAHNCQNPMLWGTLSTHMFLNKSFLFCVRKTRLSRKTSALIFNISCFSLSHPVAALWQLSLGNQSGFAPAGRGSSTAFRRSRSMLSVNWSDWELKIPDVALLSIPRYTKAVWWQ